MRKNNKLSQENMANLINVDRTTLSGYETNKRNPTFQMIEEIANKCGYKIYFDNGKEKFEAKDLKRKDI